MDLVVDISNWQGAISAALVNCWGTQGVRRVIVQAVNPGPGFPAGQTREQLQACKDAGMPSDCYVFFWDDQDPAVAENAMGLAEGFDVGYWWGDYEDDRRMTPCVDEILAFAKACDIDGVYTRRDWWEARAGNTSDLSHMMLWDAHWDRDTNPAANFTPYGGWTTRTLKQFGSGNLCGASGLDMNVINQEVFVPPAAYVGDDYWAKFGPSGNDSLTNRYDWSGVAANLEGIISQVMQRTQAPDTECEAKMTQIQDILFGTVK